MKKTIQYCLLFSFLPWEMVTLKSKRKFAFHNKETCEGHPRSNLAQNSIVPRSQEDYIAQVSEKNEGALTVFPGLQQDGELLFTGTILSRRLSSESTKSRPIRNCSRDVPAHTTYKPGNERGRLPECSSSWSGCLSESDCKLQNRWHLWQKRPIFLFKLNFRVVLKLRLYQICPASDFLDFLPGSYKDSARSWKTILKIQVWYQEIRKSRTP